MMKFIINAIQRIDVRVVLFVCAIALYCRGQDKPAIAVSRLVANGISASEANVLTDALRTELVRTGAYDVMERAQMEEILQEQGFQQSGACSEASCAIEIGQLLAVRYMVMGSIGKVGSTYSLNVRLVDIGSGKIAKETTENHKGDIDDVLTEIIPKAAQMLAGVRKKGRKKRPVLAIGIGAVAAAAIAVPVILVATKDDESNGGTGGNETADVTIKWLE